MLNGKHLLKVNNFKKKSEREAGVKLPDPILVVTSSQLLGAALFLSDIKFW